jgi:glucokinase
MDRFAWWVALGLSNLANALDPELIVIGGGLIEAGDVLMIPTRRAFQRLVEAPDARPNLRILPAALGASAGAIGAAMRAADPGPRPVNAGGTEISVK